MSFRKAILWLMFAAVPLAAGCDNGVMGPNAGGGLPAAQQNPAADPCAHLGPLIESLDHDLSDTASVDAAAKAYRELYDRRAQCPAALVEALVGRHFGRWGQDLIDKLVHETGAAAVPPLIAVLEQSPPDSDRWRIAVKTLAGYGPGVGPLLAAALKSSSPAVRLGALEALAAIGEPAAAPLAAALSDSDPAIRHRAAEALSEIGPAGRHALEALRLAMQSDDLELVFQASASIAHLSDNPQDAIPGLFRLARSQNPRRLKAIEYLAGSEDSAAILTLLSETARKDPDWEIRRAALQSLANMGAATVNERLPVIVAAVADEKDYVRDAAVGALLVAGPGVAPQAVPKLAEIAASHGRDARPSAIKALSGMGPLAVPVLVKLGETDALSKLGAAAVPSLVEMLKSQDEEAQGKALAALHEMIPADIAPAVDELNKVSAKKNKHLRAAALGVLRQLIQARIAGVSIEALRDAAGDFDDEDAQMQALFALGELGPLAMPAIPTLLSLAVCKNQEVRYQTVEQLGYLAGSADRQVIDALIKSLDDDYWRVRTFALMSLVKLGPRSAAPAAPRLEKLLKQSDLDDSDRRSAEDLLQKIREQAK